MFGGVNSVRARALNILNSPLSFFLHHCLLRLPRPPFGYKGFGWLHMNGCRVGPHQRATVSLYRGAGKSG